METKELTTEEKSALINEANAIHKQAMESAQQVVYTGAGAAAVEVVLGKDALVLGIDFSSPQGILGFFGNITDQTTTWSGKAVGVFKKSPDTISGSGKASVKQGKSDGSFIITCTDSNGSYLGVITGTVSSGEVTATTVQGNYTWKAE